MFNVRIYRENFENSFKTRSSLLNCPDVFYLKPYKADLIRILAIVDLLFLNQTENLLYCKHWARVLILWNMILFYHFIEIWFDYTVLLFILYFSLLQTSKSYLEKSIKESEDNLRELVMSKQQNR